MRRYGQSYAHPLIVLIALNNEAADSRFGIAAGRSAGKAVQRNRAKRLIRAALQPLLPSIAPGWDVVLIARRPLPEATFEQTQQALVALLQRSGLLLEHYDNE